MNRNLSFLFFFFFSLLVYGQNGKQFTLNIKNGTFQSVVKAIEGQSEYHVYYKKTWTDSLSFTVNVSDLGLSETLNKIIEGTTLSYYINGTNIIMVNDQVIIDPPKITETFSKSTEEVTDSEKGLIFKKDYLKSNELAGKTIEIGARNNFVTGATSTVAGYITELQSGNPVEGVFVYKSDMSQATSTDESGFFSIELRNGRSTLNFQLLGMKNTARNLVVFSSGRLDVVMEEDVIALREVTISSDRDANVLQTQMGVTKIDVASTKNVPVVLGEKDIMKIATTVSGVQTLGEGAAGYNVRGGKADQNLILIDGNPVYNSNHFFGFFSVFNSDAIDNLELHKSSIPAEFGGRLSSVFDLTTKTANKEKFTGWGGISPVSSKFTAEIPVIKEKSSLLLSGRGTYSNWVLKQINNPAFSENRVSFSDFIIKYDHELSKKDRVTINGYYSKDKFRMASDTLFSFSQFSYVNKNASLRWNHAFNDKWFIDNAIRLSSYSYNLNYDQSESNAFYQDFSLDEKIVESQLTFYPNDETEILMGLQSNHYSVNPGNRLPLGALSEVIPQVSEKENGTENSIYASIQQNITPEFSVYAGLRYSTFALLGPGSVYQYLPNTPISNSTLSDTTYYQNREIIQFYHGLEPRITARYSLNEETSLKASYNRNRQHLHTLSNSASLSPTDIWKLSGPYLKPQIADQVSVGYYRNFTQKRLDFSAELYYKSIQNLIDFKTGEEFLLSNNVETSILQGPGRSYGIELSAQKSGKLNGWINYTYARSLIKLDGQFVEEIINGGEYFPNNYDKPHTLNIVANYKLTRRFSFSFNMNYSSGRPVTYPVATYYYKDTQFVHYSNRNAYRIPDYFRIDAGFNIEAGHKIKKLAHNYWSFSIYNVLGRDNPFSVFFDVQNGEVNGYQLIIFGNAIPTISYNFKL